MAQPAIPARAVVFNTEYNQNFILELEQIINERYEHPQEGSYVNKLRGKAAE